MITAEVLQRATLCNSERAATWAPVLSEAMGIFAIDSPARQAAFLAQIAHESGRLIYVRELWGPLPQQHAKGRRLQVPWPGPDPDHRPGELPRHCDWAAPVRAQCARL